MSRHGIGFLNDVVTPIHPTPYHARPTARQFIEPETNRVLLEKVIEPKTAEWAAPIVLGPKKNGSFCFCVDYRKLNAIETRDSYPLCRMDECINSFGEPTAFLTLDLTLRT